MWDLPAYRIRTYLRAREQAKRLKERQEEIRRRLRAGFQKLNIEVRVDPAFGAPSRILAAWGIQSEFAAHGLKLFSAEPLPAGARVAITISDSDTFFARAILKSCYEFRSAWSVLSEDQYRYRLSFDFEAESIDEATAIAEYMRA